MGLGDHSTHIRHRIGCVIFIGPSIIRTYRAYRVGVHSSCYLNLRMNIHYGLMRV